jgi:hypothetical protein
MFPVFHRLRSGPTIRSNLRFQILLTNQTTRSSRRILSIQTILTNR